MIVAVIGHRKVKEQDKAALVFRIYETVFDLMENQGADTFLFGNKGEFDKLCFEAVMELQHLYPHVKTVYVRADSENMTKLFEDSLLKKYDETFFPDRVRNSHELCYVLRNGVMIEMCDVLLAYCDPNYQPPQKETTNKKTKSGAQMALQSAKRKRKRVINLIEN